MAMWEKVGKCILSDCEIEPKCIVYSTKKTLARRTVGNQMSLIVLMLMVEMVERGGDAP
jgi:hypothetical protein